jgi:hypothetical protein
MKAGKQREIRRAAPSDLVPPIRPYFLNFPPPPNSTWRLSLQYASWWEAFKIQTIMQRFNIVSWNQKTYHLKLVEKNGHN